MSSSIAVFRIRHDRTKEKDGYDVLMKGQMRFDGSEQFHPEDTPSTYSEIADIELTIKGINQRELLEENHLFWEGAVKLLDLRDVQTSLDQFTAHDPYKIHDHIIDQELWIDHVGNIHSRNEVRATYLDLEEEGLMEDMTFLQFLEGQTSVDEFYEEMPEMVTAIRLYKHGYEYWGQRMQIYGAEIDETEDKILPVPERVIP